MTLKGPLSLILSTILFAIAHSAVKYLGGSFSIFQLAFVRFMFAPIILLPFVFLNRLQFDIHNWRLIGLRTFFGISAMLLYFWALIHGDPGQVSLIFQSSSIWVFIIGWVFYDERRSNSSFLAIPVAFLGLFLVTAPATTGITLSDVLSLLASFMNAGVFVSLKKLRKTHTAHSILLANYSLSSLVLLAPSFVHPISLPALNTTSMMTLAFPLLVVGIFGLIGNWLMTVGFKYSSAGLSGNIMLLTVPWMYLSGLLFFDETLSLRALFGAILVLSAISVMIWKR